jgi:hypothetical protein
LNCSFFLNLLPRFLKMTFVTFLIGSTIATLATASVQPGTARHAPAIVLKPAVHPSIDRSDLTNLEAKRGVTLHYDSNADPSVDSTMATMSAAISPHPIVQLEQSKYIEQVNCSANTTQIAFSNRAAFEKAVQDWQSHNQFVIASYSPQCGSGYADGQRDFAMVNRVVADPSSMTLNADISAVDHQTAIGENTMVTTTFSNYAAPSSGGVSKRTTKSETISWNEYPTNSLADPKWGSGYQLYSSSNVELVCVHCGTQGSMTLAGTVTWTTANGITSAEVTLNGDMSITMEIGMDAQSISDTIPIGSISLAQVPLGSIDVPGIMNIGPQLDVSASASLTIGATGSMLAGATISWPSAAATLVLEGSGSSGGSDWSPSFQPVSNVQGSISATLDLNLPVEIGIGINLLNGKYNKTVGIVDTPSLKLAANASNTAPCDGVGLSADFLNNVAGDILGLTTIPIASFTTPLFSTCVGTSTQPPTTTPTPSHAAHAAHAARAAEKVRLGRRYRQIL